MSDMDYESDNVFDDDNESFEEEGSGDDAFDDTPEPTSKEVDFTSLSPEQCRAKAAEAVKVVVELLCCDQQVAQMLLRQYKWDQDKLVEGEVVHSRGVHLGDDLVPAKLRGLLIHSALCIVQCLEFFGFTK